MKKLREELKIMSVNQLSVYQIINNASIIRTPSKKNENSRKRVPTEMSGRWQSQTARDMEEELPGLQLQLPKTVEVPSKPC